MNERQLAFKILNKIERDNAYSNLTLDAALREMRPLRRLLRLSRRLFTVSPSVK